MPISLPAPDRTVLRHAPLALVVCQLRYEPVQTAGEGAVGLGIQTDLADGQYVKIDRVQAQDLSLQLGVAGVQPTVSPPVAGWRLATADTNWQATVMPQNVSLETPRYPSWDDFRARLVPLIDSVGRRLAPATAQRLGLRYVDRIVEPRVDSPQGWAGYIADSLLGPVIDAGLGPGVEAVQQQLDLDVGEGFRCTLRHGILKEPDRQGALTYVIDIDASIDRLRPFDVEGITAEADHLNEISLQVFQRAVTPRLLDILRSE